MMKPVKQIVDRIIEKVYNNVKQSDEYYAIKVQREEWRKNKWLQYIKAITPYENMYIKEIKRIFIDQEKEVLANLKRTAKALYKKESISVILPNKQRWNNILKKKNIELNKGIIVDYGQDTIDDLDIIGISFDVDNPRVTKFVNNNGVVFGKEVNDTAYDSLKWELSEGIREGEAIPELAERIGRVYDGYTKTDAPYKTVRIARTETIKASNFGALDGYKQSGVVIGKEWLATRDDRVRDEHLMADGQRVKINERFNVGGESLDYPGDGSAEMSINCRCTILSILEGEKI